MRKFMAFNSVKSERQSQEFDYIINIIIISQYRVKFTRRRVKYVRIIAYKVERKSRLLHDCWRSYDWTRCRSIVNTAEYDEISIFCHNKFNFNSWEKKNLHPFLTPILSIWMHLIKSIFLLKSNLKCIFKAKLNWQSFFVAASTLESSHDDDDANYY